MEGEPWNTEHFLEAIKKQLNELGGPFSRREHIKHGQRFTHITLKNRIVLLSDLIQLRFELLIGYMVCSHPVIVLVRELCSSSAEMLKKQFCLDHIKANQCLFRKVKYINLWLCQVVASYWPFCTQSCSYSQAHHFQPKQTEKQEEGLQFDICRQWFEIFCSKMKKIDLLKSVDGVCGCST